MENCPGCKKPVVKGRVYYDPKKRSWHIRCAYAAIADLLRMPDPLAPKSRVKP